MIAAVAVGVLTWTFLEYVIHRWMGHDRRFRKTPFGAEHVRHHSEGNHFAPYWKKLIAFGLFAVVLGIPAIALLGTSVGAAYTAGLLGFYLVYEWVHRREHTHAGIGPYGRFLRRHHFHHHFSDTAQNHGVTTPIWDFVFGTYQTPAQIRVPAKLCMTWLLDPATGDVRAEHRGAYQLR